MRKIRFHSACCEYIGLRKKIFRVHAAGNVLNSTDLSNKCNVWSGKINSYKLIKIMRNSTKRLA